MFWSNRFGRTKMKSQMRYEYGFGSNSRLVAKGIWIAICALRLGWKAEVETNGGSSSASERRVRLCDLLH